MDNWSYFFLIEIVKETVSSDNNNIILIQLYSVALNPNVLKVKLIGLYFLWIHSSCGKYSMAYLCEFWRIVASLNLHGKIELVDHRRGPIGDGPIPDDDKSRVSNISHM